jgi:WD40 repeat protein
VESMAFSADGAGLLACGLIDSTIHILNGLNGQFTLLEGHTDMVSSVSFSPNGKLLASGSFDQTIRLWKLDDQSYRIFEGHANQVISVAFSPDGSTIASGSSVLVLWFVVIYSLLFSKRQDYRIGEP